MKSSPPTGEGYGQWEAARELAALLKNCPRFVTAAIHFLRRDVEENGNQISRTALSCLTPLLRSKSFKAVVYYAAKEFHPDRLKGNSFNHPRKLAKLFKPDEFIALVALTYLHRRMKKGCNRELFQNYIRNVSDEWVLSAAVGKAIDKIGFADGLLFGALPGIAQCLFLGVDKKRFKAYRVHLRRERVPFDLAYEERTWGCNCLQIAVLLAQNLGLGKHYHDPLILGVGAESLSGLENNDSLYRARLIQTWVEALSTTAEAPDMMHRGEFYPFASEMARLTQTALNLAESRDETFLFDRGEEDISEELTPELFAEDTTPTEVVSLEESSADLPDELKSEENFDFDKMLESLADDLTD